MKVEDYNWKMKRAKRANYSQSNKSGKWARNPWND